MFTCYSNRRGAVYGGCAVANTLRIVCWPLKRSPPTAITTRALGLERRQSIARVHRASMAAVHHRPSFSLRRSARDFRTFGIGVAVHPGTPNEHSQCETRLLARMRGTSRPVQSSPSSSQSSSLSSVVIAMRFPPRHSDASRLRVMARLRCFCDYEVLQDILGIYTNAKKTEHNV